MDELIKLIFHKTKGVNGSCDNDFNCSDCCCLSKMLACFIYEAGYRKVPKNERFVNNMKNVLEIEKANAVKEFVQKVKKCSYFDNIFRDGKWHRYVFVDDIDGLLKEYER